MKTPDWQTEERERQETREQKKGSEYDKLKRRET